LFFFGFVDVALMTLWFRSAVGAFHTLTIAPDGAVFAWGANTCGQAGAPPPPPPPPTVDPSGGVLPSASAAAARRALDPPVRVPVRVAELADVVAVAAGAAHSMALLRDGSVCTWGENGYGEVCAFVPSVDGLEI
jgi:alpha-tubulin suppressor-like RCC1 family protein